MRGGPAYARGDVVIVPFPYSGAPGEKPRPALVLAAVPYAGRTDYVVCVISSQAAPDPHLITLDGADVQGGTLARRSYLRPNYLFTTGEPRIAYKIGTLNPQRVAEALRVLAGTFAS